ncbi:TonB-dependent receptor [Paludibacterium paludis]|uniref:TonB-dependent receptor n=1 Tax=Paludibacterium paludis TaxID=1225769 RepID=A0A918U8J3_9NEIS|nr:TonB-dependent receptor [Paludibacterium paludis]
MPLPPYRYRLLFILLSCVTHQAVAAEASTELPTVNVTATRKDKLTGKSMLDKESIKERPNQNGNLTDLLRDNPAVQFSNAAGSSMTPGELRPDQISIHGSPFWQNQFRLDGMGTNNDLDPADRGQGQLVVSTGSDTQGFYVDSRLLESVTVMDSNVPAEFGGFTGGVIDARTKRYSGSDHFAASWRTTRDSWTKQPLDPEMDSAAQRNDASAPSRFQQQFKKNFYTVSAEKGLGRDWGMVMSLSRRESTIPSEENGGILVGAPGRPMIELVDDGNKQQKRAIDNALVKFSWVPGAATAVDLSLNAARSRESLFLNGLSHSDYTRNHDSYGASISWTQRLERGRFEAVAGVGLQDDRRDTPAKERRKVGDIAELRELLTRQAEGMPSPQKEQWLDVLSRAPILNEHGGYGNLRSRQRTYEARFKFEADPLATGPLTHALSAGVQLAKVKANYLRPEDSVQVTYGCRYDATGCSGAFDPVSRTVFPKGESGTRFSSNGLWLEDRVNYGRVEARLGLRVDRDDFLRETLFAPRLALGWDVNGDGRWLMNAGLNRYYGRSMLAYKLKEAENRGLYQETLDWSSGGSEPDVYRTELGQDYGGYAGLRTPYEDETLLGLTYRGDSAVAGVRYVHRDGHDPVVRDRQFPDAIALQTKLRLLEDRLRGPGLSNAERAALRRQIAQFRRDNADMLNKATFLKYVNRGKSRYDAVIFELRNARPFALAGSFTQASVSLTLSRQRTSLQGSDGYNSMTSDYHVRTDKVWHNGQLVDVASLNSPDYNRPRALNLNVSTQWPSYGLSLSHQLRWRSKVTQPEQDRNSIKKIGDEYFYMVRDERLPSTFTWDARLLWKPAFAGGMYTSLEVSNLLNRRNVTGTYTYGDKRYRRYEMGRQFWAEIGYEF